MEKVTYADARKDPEKRSLYLQQIDLGKAAPFIKRVQYAPEGATDDDEVNALMSVRPSIRAALFGTLGTKSIIKVDPLAFQKLENESDLLSGIIEHEGTHALYYSKNPRMVIYTMRDILCDLLRLKNVSEIYDRKHWISERKATNAQIAAHKAGDRILSPRVLDWCYELSKRYKNKIKELKMQK